MDAKPPSDGWIAAAPQKTNRTALAALGFAIGGFTCLWGAGGVLAVVLGLIARREIAASSSSEGRAIATTSIALGALNILATAGAFVATVAFVATRAAGVPGAALTPIPTAAPSPTAVAPHKHTPKARASASYDPSAITTRIGAITLVDVGVRSGTLGSKLEAQQAEARAEAQTLLLWIIAPSCRPCDGVAAALSDPALQRELAHVRLVRVDASDFPVELEQLGVSTEKIPGFGLLDAHHHLRDFIHGGEWDADIAANIAPILGKFVRGEYRTRRHPWRENEKSQGTPT